VLLAFCFQRVSCGSKLEKKKIKKDFYVTEVGD